jgi:hypothetical protein
MSSEFDLSAFTPHLTSLQSVINRKKPAEVDMIWSLLSLFMYGRPMAPELLEIFKAFDLVSFTKLLHIVGGKEIKFPSVSQLEDHLISALLYVEKEENGLSWDQIKKRYPQLTISALRYSMKFKSMNEFMRRHLANISVAPEELTIIEEVGLDEGE